MMLPENFDGHECLVGLIPVWESKSPSQIVQQVKDQKYSLPQNHLPSRLEMYCVIKDGFLQGSQSIESLLSTPALD
jgi:hypothetical protein